MAFKAFVIDDKTTVTVYKRAGSRSLRLSLTSAGQIRVTIPAWAPYTSGLQFARSRLDWIQAQQPVAFLLKSGQAVGKAHHLIFSEQSRSKRISSRTVSGQIIIGYPPHLTADDMAVQKVAAAACIRALRRQAEQLLPQRLAKLAASHSFDYKSVNIKQLKSRWGSCDQSKNIVLNLYLMQLPWDYIDYVLIHELVHTKVLHHGPDFWQLFESVLPQAKQRRKLLRQHQPVLQSAPAIPSEQLEN